MSPSRIFLLVGGFFLLITINSTLFTVVQFQQALVLQFGNPVRVIQEPGLQVKMPFIQDVIYFDKRIIALDAPEQEVTLADQRRLAVNAFGRYKITDPKRFYETLNNQDRAADRLETMINSNLFQVFGRSSFQQVLSTERVNLMAEIKQLLNKDAASLGVEVVDVRVTRTDLPESNSLAIYNRMRTDREKEAREARARGAEEAQRIRARAERERTVLVAEARRDAQILRGEGDQQALAIVNGTAQQDAEFYRFVLSMDAYKQALKTNSSIVMSPDGDFFRYMENSRSPK